MTAALLLAPRGRVATRWRDHGIALVLVAAALLALFARDVAAIADQWWSSSSYEHCLAIPPIVAWLVWRRRAALAATPPRAWPPGLLLAAAGALAWLLGEAAAVAVIRQFALLAMIEGAVIALIGPAASRLLAFPLGYAIFLVPAGDALIPPLQIVTAHICMALLVVAGIPATLTGVFIATPDGWFEVAAACAGVKFLIAMVALGVLAAHLCFAGWRRRLAFLAACVIVPILANGVRAWTTIFMAHFFGASAATGYDHIIYGWFFFAGVIALLLAGSWRFFDRLPTATAGRAIAGPAGERRSLIPVAIAALLLASAPIAWMRALAAAGAAELPARIELPAPRGWHRVTVAGGPAAGVPWAPRFDGADRFAIGRYADGHGRSADLAIAVYASQDAERRLVGYGHGAVDPDGAWAWSRDLAAPSGGRAELIAGPNQVTRTVLSFYRVGRTTTGSDVAVKLETLKVRLFGGPARAAALLVSADDRQGGRGAADALLAALGDPTEILEADSTGAGPR